MNAAIVPVTPLQQNCTLLWDDVSKAAWVFDPGGDVPRIRAAIEELGLTPERILLTHGHIDHAGGAAELRDALNLPLEGPDERDAFLLDELQYQGARFGIVGARNVRPDRWLREGDAVTLGPHRFDVLHCPGHTPGHIVLVDPTAGLAIVGDVLFQGSVGRTDFPYGDTGALLDSIRDKLLPLGDGVAFLCGHGPGSTIGAERRSNPFVREALSRAQPERA
ncbi:MAG: MBL fold metallo-hydrolase [Acetobacteraceae bacterium]|nr:MBL fold metallo-hydrolase [Acetobacteraceae bacterium]